MTWMVAEATVAITAGLIAASIAGHRQGGPVQEIARDRSMQVLDPAVSFL